ncbi:DNA topoisomerase 3-beta isoform X2 [Lutzomyia longipalpis]|uniref:DNA topoisomerase n=1 Tax=Lutzomyia longipalpis TaxID=7200 RepID=A0A1B0CLS7_LUTLO|nr:DNA topoisomerase 3-beta isoform X1 [Lutzomyia longipalpis]XP_055684589.1 DNA topoisomerase 3-beta isoform X2 [Lutzomyia longipalpis]
MKSVLMVAEKPSLAASLANILANGKVNTRKGLNNACSIHEWRGTFRGESVQFKMTSVCGHVMSLDFIGKYNSWDKVDPIELFSCPTEKKEATPKLKMPYFLSQEARGCDYLVLWLDCDKEGENICFEVMNAVSKNIRNVFSKDVTFRARFSAITEKDIRMAMNNLVHPNENEARSVDARQELDLRIGCAFTRYQTKFFQGRYSDLDSSLISYGPCQTPTLGFCVQRHDAIQTFKPETFYYLQATVGNPEVTLEWSRVRVFEKDIAQLFYNRVKDAREATVESVKTKDSFKSRPQALNTVELMKAASSGLGLGPHTAMQIAEKLYTQGYISYPRTETTQYSPNFDLHGTVRLFQSSTEFGEEARGILGDFNQPRKGVDCGDHPPITPMKCASRGDFDSDTWRVYDYICRHFLATVSRDLKYKTTHSNIRIGEEAFSVTTNVLVDAGYTKVMTWQAFGKNEKSPFVEGEVIKVNSMRIAESQTGPPDYLTESELISLMEQHGIGTDASIPVHINNISQRNYVTVGTGRRLIPTTLGIVLVHGYQKIDPELVLPTMRSAVEKMLNLIAQGSANFSMVLNHALEIFKMKFVFFVKNIANMDTLFEVSFSSLADSGKSFSRCGKCRRYMKYIQMKPARLHCSNCDDTYALPNGGTVRVYKELKCPLDDFELVAFSSGIKGRSYPLCPYCYNNSPFPDMPRNSGCNQCTNPTCPHSLTSLGVSSCSECNRGVLVLDCTSAPKSWKLGCNSCDVIINIFKDASKVSVEEDACEDCNAQQVSVVYKQERTKFKDGSEEKTGCIFCTEDFQRLVEKHRAVHARAPMANRRGRGGSSGGGGGRGGRGGGGNRGKPPKDKMAQLAAYFV